MRKIKVAFFAENLIRDFDGASRTMFHIIDRIPREGFEYIFICGVPPKHDIEFPVVTTHAFVIPFNTSYRVSFPYIRKKYLTERLDSFKPDVIHIATPSMIGNWAISYAKERNLPILSIYHTHFVSYMQYYFRYVPFLVGMAESIVTAGYRKFYNQCDLIYVPTAHMIHKLIESGIDASRMKLWQRGLNRQLFTPSKRDPQYIQRITGNTKPVILYASRLVWEKNIRTLIEIYKETKHRDIDCEWIVAGNGVAQADAQAEMPEAHFLGHVGHSHLSILYASSEVFVFPSISEAYGNVVVEAMTSGAIPVIAKGGGSMSLVDDGITGYLCQPNEASDYVDKIQYLLTHTDEANQMRSNGYLYTQHLDWETLVGEYFTDIRQLANDNIE